jgi:dTDP-4-dehydrorhamnose reductase
VTKLLVIGGGLLGREVARISRDDFETALTFNSNRFELKDCRTCSMDITKDVNLIKSLSPDYIVLTAALTDVDLCESNRNAAWNVNALGPERVAAAAKKIGAKLIYISTDYVFNGERGMYMESDPVSPINFYGESKLAGEKIVQQICPDCIVARSSVLYGWNPVRHNFVTWAIEQMKKGIKINVVKDQCNSPTLASNLAEMILQIRDSEGLFHACGSERISRYDFVIDIARAFELDESLVNPITSDLLNWKAKRPKDSSMDISRISNFTKPLNVKDGLKSMLKMRRDDE